MIFSLMIYDEERDEFFMPGIDDMPTVSKEEKNKGLVMSYYDVYDDDYETTEDEVKLLEKTVKEIVSKYVEMNIAHPFMEGNGTSMRIWLDLMLKKNLKKCVDWSKIDKTNYLNAMKESTFDDKKIQKLIQKSLTDKINSREIFMKGIDYSYYYESY